MTRWQAAGRLVAGRIVTGRVAVAALAAISVGTLGWGLGSGSAAGFARAATVKAASQTHAASVKAAPAHAGLQTYVTSARAAQPVRVVATTPILADLARQVGGAGATVTSLVPPGADPHSFEPSLSQIRAIAYADVAFTNHLLLEEAALIHAVETNLPQSAKLVPVAESAARYGAQYLPLVEDASLSTIWLGARIKAPQQSAKTQTGAIEAVAYDYLPAPGSAGVDFENTGHLSAFVTGTFGQLEPYFVTRDGLCQRRDCTDDRLTLPAGAHTHLSWAFSAPGWYRLQLRGRLDDGTLTPTYPLVFAVGVNPQRPPQAWAGPDKQVLGEGHVDVTLDTASRTLFLQADPPANFANSANPVSPANSPATSPAGSSSAATPTPVAGAPAPTHGGPTAGGVNGSLAAPDLGAAQARQLPLASTVIEVPNLTVTLAPARSDYRFVARPGKGVYVLAQAVLGKHVHGEVDPHMWLSVPSAQAYVQVIRDALAAASPARADYFARRAAAYLRRLRTLHRWLEDTIGSIPPARRRLVTTHDAYGYLARAYGLQVSGFVSPNPSLEPSARDMVRLSAAVAAERVPALFLEPFALSGAAQLRQVAAEQGVRLCQLWSDTFSVPSARQQTGARQQVYSYEQLMYTNGYNLKVCLDPDGAPPAPPDLPGLPSLYPGSPSKDSLVRIPGHKSADCKTGEHRNREANK